MTRVLVAALAAAFLVPARQDAQEKAPASPAVAGDAAVSVPVFPNTTCPIMGKPISQKLFVDTELGRIYFCCKGCNKKILGDVAVAYKSAYPRTTKLANALCPVSGKPVGEKPATVLLQGREIALCCEEHVAAARDSSQVVLAKASDPKLVDVGNAICPVSAAPVAKNAFCVIDGRLVRLSSPECVEGAKKEPLAVLAKALAGAPR